MPYYEQAVEITYACPYCGETIGSLLDPAEADAAGSFEYIEDCTVCCCPIVISGSIDQDNDSGKNPAYSVYTRREND